MFQVLRIVEIQKVFTRRERVNVARIQHSVSSLYGIRFKILRCFAARRLHISSQFPRRFTQQELFYRSLAPSAPQRNGPVKRRGSATERGYVS